MTRARLTVGTLAALAYLATVVAANWAVNEWGVQPIAFGLTAPAAVYFAGLAFTLRDLTQEAFGRGTRLAGSVVLTAIAAGAALSYLTGAVLWPSHNPVASATRIAVASAIAFGLSELLDYAVYTPLRTRGWLRAVTASNLAGLLLDSLLFLAIAFGSLHYLAGQIVGKTIMTGLAIGLLALAGAERRQAVAAA